MINKQAMTYVRETHAHFLSVLDPLISTTPLNGFGYMEFLGPEKVFQLCTDLVWVQDYISSALQGNTFKHVVSETLSSQANKESALISPFIWSIVDSRDPLEQRCAQLGHRFGMNFSEWDEEKQKLKIWVFTAADAHALLFFQTQKQRLEDFLKHFNAQCDVLITHDRVEENAAQMCQVGSSGKLVLPNALLTHRQLKILQCYAQGLSMKEIARILGGSSRTIEGIIQTIRTKTGCHTRSQLIGLSKRFWS